MPTDQEIQSLLSDQKTTRENWVKSQIEPMDLKLIEFMSRKKELVEQFKSKLSAESLPISLSEGPSEEEKLQKFKKVQEQLESAQTPDELKPEWAKLVRNARKELQQLVALSGSQPDNEELSLLVSEASNEVAKSELASSEEEVIKYLEELFVNESTFITNILKLRTILSPYREKINLKKLTTAQRESVTKYLNDMDSLLKAYQELDFYQPIAKTGAILIPEEVIIDADRVFQTEQFIRYTDIMKSLAYSQKTIDAIAEENATFQQMTADRVAEQQSLGSYTIRPLQHISRYSLQWGTIVKELRELVDKADAVDNRTISDGRESRRSSTSEVSISSDSSCSSAESAYHQSKRVGDSLNLEFGNKDSIAIAEAQMKAAPRSVAERQTFVLRKILELNLNTSLQNNITHPESKYLDPYLKTMLVQSYSNIFSLNNEGQFVVKDDKYKAFGLSSNTTFEFDPVKFNAEILNNLYQGSGHTLWLVLKSIIPVSATFTAKQKIQAYQQLAEAVIDRKLGGTDKYIMAQNLQNAAFAIATKHGELLAFTAAFGPKSTLGKYIDEKIKKHRSSLKSISIEDIQEEEKKVVTAVTKQKMAIQKELDEVALKLQTESKESQSLNQELTVIQNLIDAFLKRQIESKESQSLPLAMLVHEDSSTESTEQLESEKKINEMEIAYKQVQSQLSSVTARVAEKSESVIQLEALLNQLKDCSTREEEKLTAAGVIAAGVIKEDLTSALCEQKAAIDKLQQELTTVTKELSAIVGQEEVLPVIIQMEKARLTSDSYRRAVRANRVCAINVVRVVEESSEKISFDEFYQAFQIRFEKTNSTGIKRMIKFMESIKDSKSKNDEDKFRETTLQMRAIAGERTDSEWLTNKKFGILGRGRSAEVQALYNEMRSENFSLTSEDTKKLLMGEDSSLQTKFFL